jgi:hypothetical protein
MKKSLVNLYVESADQLKRATDLLVQKTSDWQTIKNFLTNRFEDLVLTKQQQEKLDRYQFIYNQLSSGKYTESDVVQMLMKHFDIKMVQAYEDLKSTKEIYSSSVIQINKRFELKMELESARDMKRKCTSTGQLKTAAIIQKNIIALLSMFPDEEENPGQDFEGHTFEVVFNPELLGPGASKVNMQEVLKAINEKRKTPINIDMFPELDSVEIKNEKTDTL